LILVATLVVLPALFELVGRRIDSRRIMPPPETVQEEEPTTTPKAASGGLRR
jgi:hypothetical protein